MVLKNSVEGLLDGRSFLPQLLRAPAEPREWIVSYFKGRDRGANKNAGYFWIGNHDWKLDHTGKLFHLARDPLEKPPILARDDTSETAAVREKFQTTLDTLHIDCRKLWIVVPPEGKPRRRENRRVKIYGKPKWGS